MAEIEKQRKISTDKYVVAGVITLLIFSLGLTLGFILESQRYSTVEELTQEQDVQYLSLQMQYLYLNSVSNYDNCPILSTTLKATMTDLSQSLSKVVAFEEQNKASTVRSNVIQRRYVLDNIRYWLLATESKKKCHLNIVPIVYFYTSTCTECPQQGTVLTHFKDVFGEQVLVFPLNMELKEQEPMVEIMTQQFNITTYPSLVIDDQKYEGMVSKDLLQNIICSSLNDSTHCS